MANLKEVRIRIGSVITTQQITKAMKLVSASKLRKAQSRILSMRPYSGKLSDMLANIIASIEGDELSVNFNQQREVKNVLIILITSDKGLCGGFNSNLIKKAFHLVFNKYGAQQKSGNLKMLCLGKKGYEYFRSRGVEVINDHVDIFNRLSFENVSEISQYTMDSFLDGTYDVVETVYAQFKNAATQIMQVEKFLPLVELDSDESDNKMKPDFIFEPEKIALINELIPKILKTQFFRYLLDSSASEHGARMVAMDQATENADEILKDLKLIYNRQRQAAITKEILEIVGGAAALEGR